MLTKEKKVKTASIILLIALLSSSFFYCVSLNISLIQARLDAREKLSKEIPNQDLTLIKIPSKDAKEIEEKEIWYNDKLYDIATTVVSKDTIYYYVIEDNKEQETLGMIYEHFNTEFNSLYPQGFKLTFHKSSNKGIYQLYCFKRYEYKQHRNSSFVDYTNQNSSCSPGFHKVLTPPPKNIPVSTFII